MLNGIGLNFAATAQNQKKTQNEINNMVIQNELLNEEDDEIEKNEDNLEENKKNINQDELVKTISSEIILDKFFILSNLELKKANKLMKIISKVLNTSKYGQKFINNPELLKNKFLLLKVIDKHEQLTSEIKKNIIENFLERYGLSLEELTQEYGSKIVELVVLPEAIFLARPSILEFLIKSVFTISYFREQEEKFNSKYQEMFIEIQIGEIKDKTIIKNSIKKNIYNMEQFKEKFPTIDIYQIKNQQLYTINILDKNYLVKINRIFFKQPSKMAHYVFHVYGKKAPQELMKQIMEENNNHYMIKQIVADIYKKDSQSQIFPIYNDGEEKTDSARLLYYLQCSDQIAQEAHYYKKLNNSVRTNIYEFEVDQDLEHEINKAAFLASYFTQLKALIND